MHVPASLRLSPSFLALLCTFAGPAMAVQVTDNLDLGGAVRARWDYDPDRDIQKFGLDTVFLSAKYNSDTWIGEAQYRFYGRSYPYQYTKNSDPGFSASVRTSTRASPLPQGHVGAGLLARTSAQTTLASTPSRASDSHLQTFQKQ